MSASRIALVAGEHSGDQLGAKLAGAAKADFAAPLRPPAPLEVAPPRPGRKPPPKRRGESRRADRRR